ncbi:MAG: TRAP transporter TatT component family protein [Treponema sp.]|jgi:predicted anti-sigma-YlaC factor YlaD|nr:TRAP transporter TatT component family protein [Treponema sp.]
MTYSKILLVLTVPLLFLSCSINKLVINKVSDSLTGEGQNEVFMGDSDPELVAGALPFAIKMYETLLANNPNHQGLIVTTGSLFIMYANAFVQGPAEFLPPEAYREKQAQMERAGRLYRRGAVIIEGGREKKYPGWNDAKNDPEKRASFLAGTKKEDVPLLYWTAAGVLSAYALNPFDLDLGMRIPELSALVARAYELDPGYNFGALDEFYLLFYASLPEGMGGDMEKAEFHYKKALEKSKGLTAGPHVSYAKAVAVPAQDYRLFTACLEAALAIDTEHESANRLVNILAQNRARYLLENAAEFFAELDDGQADP